MKLLDIVRSWLAEPKVELKAAPLPVSIPSNLVGIEDEIDRGRIVFESSEKSALSDLMQGSGVDQYVGVGKHAGDVDGDLHIASTSLWVQLAISQLATNIASVPMKATRRNRAGKLEDAPDSDLQRILDSPSPGVSRTDFIEQAWTFLEASGSSFIAVARSGGSITSVDGRAESLVPLRPSRVTIHPGREEWIDAITHNTGSKRTRIPFANVIYMRNFDPTNDYWGLSRITAIRRSVEADAAVIDYNASVIARHGVPTMLLSSDQRVNRQSARRIEREWMAKRGRADQAGGVTVVDQGMKPTPSQFPPRDMEWLAMHRVSKRRILSSFGVPPAIAMDFDEASELANAKSQRVIFYENTIQPRARKLVEALTAFAVAEYGPEWGVRLAWEDVDALQEDEASTHKNIRDDYQGGLITRNEARMRLALEPVADGDEFFEPSSAGGGAPFDDAPSKSIEPVVTLTTPVVTLPAAKTPTIEKKGAQATGEMRRLSRGSYLRRHKRWSGEMKKSLVAFFTDEKTRVLAKARGLLGDGKSMQKSPLSPDDILHDIFNTRKEAEAFRKKLGPVFVAGIVDAGNAKMEDLLSEEHLLAFQETHRRVESAVERWGAEKVVGITNESKDGLRDVIADGLNTGASNYDIQQAIGSYFDRMIDGAPASESRVERIARTEIGTALNSGGFEATRQIEDAGGKVVKSWLSARDELVRASHVDADAESRGDPIPLNKAFSNGLMHPNDPSGPAGEVINCRCSMIEEVLEPPKTE